jgi:hypothetical protein
MDKIEGAYAFIITSDFFSLHISKKMKGDLVHKEEEEWREKYAIKKRNGARKPTISIYN